MPIEIKAKVDISGALPNLTKIQTKIDSILNSVKALNTELQKTAGLARNAAQAVSGIKGAGSSSASAYKGSPRGPSKPPDPFKNNPMQGMRYFAQAAAAGHPFAAKKFNQYQNQAKQVNKGQKNAQQFLNPNSGNPLLGVLKGVFKRTRFGIGKAQVLGGDLLKLVGGGGSGGSGGSASVAASAMSSLGIDAAAAAAEVELLINPVTMVIGALVLMASAAKAAYDALEKIADSYVRGGGTTGEAQAANTMGNATGIDVAGLGKSLDPIASSAAGVSPVTGPYGDNNYNLRGLKALDAIRNAPNMQEARRLAEHAGNVNAASVKLLDDDQYKSLRNSTNGPSESRLKDAKSIDASMAILSRDFDTLKIAIGGPLLHALAIGLKWLTAQIDDTVDKLRKLKRALDDIYNWILDKLHIPHDSADKTAKAADKFAQGASDFNDAVGRFQGTTGGGSRAQNAGLKGIQDYRNNDNYRSSPLGIF